MSDEDKGPEQVSQEAKEEREAGGVPDEDLPEDLRADTNPLAADPDSDDAPGSDDSGGDGEKPGPAGGMPDMGQPG